MVWLDMEMNILIIYPLFTLLLEILIMFTIVKVPLLVMHLIILDREYLVVYLVMGMAMVMIMGMVMGMAVVHHLLVMVMIMGMVMGMAMVMVFFLVVILRT